jgi:hypothetical protein
MSQVIDNLTTPTYARKDLYYTQFETTSDFYNVLGDIMAGIESKESFQLPGGVSVNPETPGGMIQLQLYMTIIQSKQDLVQGMVSSGLNLEKKSWSMS